MCIYYNDLARVIQEERVAQAARARLAAEMRRVGRERVRLARGAKPGWLRTVQRPRLRTASAHGA